MKSKSPEKRLSRFTRKLSSFPSYIDKKRVYILPTRPGLIFLFIIFVIFVGSFNENNNMGLLFSFFLFSVFLISIWETRSNLLGIKIVSINIEKTFAQSDSRLVISVNSENRKREMLSFESAGSSSLIEFCKKSRAKNTQLNIPGRKRGIFDIPPIVISSEYPLGIFRAWSYAVPDKKQVVFPKPSLAGLPVNQSGYDDRDSNKDNTINDTKEDIFEGLREYVKGDNIKRISWKSYSKGMGLHVKNFHSESGPDNEVTIFWDRIKGNDTEKKLSMICKSILDFESSGIRYGIEIPGFKVAPSKGLKHRDFILEILAGW